MQPWVESYELYLKTYTQTKNLKKAALRTPHSSDGCAVIWSTEGRRLSNSIGQTCLDIWTRLVTTRTSSCVNSSLVHHTTDYMEMRACSIPCNTWEDPNLSDMIKYTILTCTLTQDKWEVKCMQRNMYKRDFALERTYWFSITRTHI